MFIRKKKISHSSFELYHNADMSMWVDKFDQNIAVGNTYETLKYGTCRIERINMTPRIKMTSFLFFWFEVEPDYELTIVISYLDQGMKCVGAVKAKEFIKSLTPFSLFSAELDQRVLSKK